MFCEFCGSGPECVACGRGVKPSPDVRHVRGCTVVTVDDKSQRSRLIVGGTHTLPGVAAYARAGGRCRVVVRLK